jgi:cytoskeletal protein CcmA (bactofilin family)
VIPAGQHFRWLEPVRVEAADIGGELVATLQTSGTVRLRSTARFFGAVQAPNLIVEAGAVFVGTARVGPVADGAATGARQDSPVR